MIGNATSGIQAMGPPIQAIARTNRIANGRSTSVVMVAEVTNSRNDSNSWTLFANAPTDAGRPAIRIPTTVAKIFADSVMSARLPATSMKYARSVRISRSKQNTHAAPIVSTQSVE
jgi:hypothetical protein